MQNSKLDWRIGAAFVRFARGFWNGNSAPRAWLWTVALGASLSLSIAATLAMNHWSRWFFDAIERKDAETAGWAVLVFGAIVASMAAVGVGIVVSRETLQVRWREWLVGRLVGLWLGKNRFYHLGATHTEPDNPEYRISDDTRWATESFVDLAIGLFSAIVGATAFIGILWSVGGSYTGTLGGTTYTMPAYMVLVALAYGALASGLMLWVGRALAGCVARKNAAEGEFRFSLMRLRENAESVALIGGAAAEERAAARIYDTLVGRWLAIVRQHGRLTWITNASGPMLPIVPLLFAAPKYFAGELSLGEVMQIAAAFVQVQAAISWIVDNYSRISEWLASAKRVMDMVNACEDIDARFRGIECSRMRRNGSSDNRIRLGELCVFDQNCRPLIARADLALALGERVHIAGNSSAGKTILARVMAGLWPWGEGRVELPLQARLMVVPQKPYLPLGTLRDALTYPCGTAVNGENVERLLAEVGLAYLAPRLDEEERWDKVLGNGERQRLCLARAILHRPDVLILDDALCSLDEDAQDALHATIAARLPHAAVISFGQRARVDGFHTCRWELEKSAQGARLRTLRPALLIA